MKLEWEYAYWQAVLHGLTKPKVPVIEYIPEKRRLPERVLQVGSAWKGIESILSDLIEKFEVKTDRCLEFGVDYGYSTVALSSFFDNVVGVDTFVGDKHMGSIRDIYADTRDRLSSFKNIELKRNDYRDWILNDQSTYDLIQVDIIHTYSDTYTCGRWSAHRSKCVIFHDTQSFPAVKAAVTAIARETGKSFHEFKESNGLGILV
jgi:hypothetical protein